MKLNMKTLGIVLFLTAIIGLVFGVALRRPQRMTAVDNATDIMKYLDQQAIDYSQYAFGTTGTANVYEQYKDDKSVGEGLLANSQAENASSPFKFDITKVTATKMTEAANGNAASISPSSQITITIPAQSIDASIFGDNGKSFNAFGMVFTFYGQGADTDDNKKGYCDLSNAAVTINGSKLSDLSDVYGSLPMNDPDKSTIITRDSSNNSRYTLNSDLTVTINLAAVQGIDMAAVDHIQIKQQFANTATNSNLKMVVGTLNFTIPLKPTIDTNTVLPENSAAYFGVVSGDYTITGDELVIGVDDGNGAIDTRYPTHEITVKGDAKWLFIITNAIAAEWGLTADHPVQLIVQETQTDTTNTGQDQLDVQGQPTTSHGFDVEGFIEILKTGGDPIALIDKIQQEIKDDDDVK